MSLFSREEGPYSGHTNLPAVTPNPSFTPLIYSASCVCLGVMVVSQSETIKVLPIIKLITPYVQDRIGQGIITS
jgi:hypothetical protein